MSTRYWKNEDGGQYIELEGVGYATPEYGAWTYGPLNTVGLIECDASWQPLKPVVREWVDRFGDRWKLAEGKLRFMPFGPTYGGEWTESMYASVEEFLANQATAGIREVTSTTESK